MSKQYGYLKEPSSYSSTSNSYEIGWSFSVVKTIFFVGFRYRSLGTGTFLFHLWDVESRELLYTSEPIAGLSSGVWQDIECEQIRLEKNKTYLISFSGYNNYTYYYYRTPSDFTLNTDYISYVSGCYGRINNFPPDKENYLYGLDLIFLTNLAKYLVSSEDKYYTVINNELSEIPVENTLTASIFEEYGVDEISSDLLKTLVNPRLYAWSADSTIKCGCNVTATPKTQIIYSDKCDLTDETIKGVENIESIFEGSPLLAMSFDEKQTWEAYTGTEWVILSEDNTGSLPNIYEGLTIDQWAEKLNGINSIYFRVVIPTKADKLTSIKLNFLN